MHTTTLAGCVHVTMKLLLHSCYLRSHIVKGKGRKWPTSSRSNTLTYCACCQAGCVCHLWDFVLSENFFSTFVLLIAAGHILPVQRRLLWSLGLLVHLWLQPLSGQRPQFGESVCLMSCLSNAGRRESNALWARGCFVPSLSIMDFYSCCFLNIWVVDKHSHSQI